MCGFFGRNRKISNSFTLLISFIYNQKNVCRQHITVYSLWLQYKQYYTRAIKSQLKNKQKFHRKIQLQHKYCAMSDNKDKNKERSRTVESGYGNIEQAPKIGQLQYAFAPSSSFISRHPYPHPYSANLKKRSDMIELQRKGSDIRNTNSNKMQYKSSKKYMGYSNIGSKRVSTASSIVPSKTSIQTQSQKPIHTHNFDSNYNTVQSPSIIITMPLRSQEKNPQYQNQIKMKDQITLTAKSIQIKEKYARRDGSNKKNANGEQKQKGKQKEKHRQIRELKGKKQYINPEIDTIRTQPCQTNSPNKYQSAIENMEIQVKMPQSQILSTQITAQQKILQTCPNLSQQIPSRSNQSQTKRPNPKRIYSAVPTAMTIGTTGMVAKIKNPYKTSTVNFSQHFTLLQASHKQHKEYKKEQMNLRQEIEMKKMGPFPYCKKLTISNVNKYYQLCIEEIKNNSKQLQSRLQSKNGINCQENQQISQERQKEGIMTKQINNENELKNKNLNQQILFEQSHHNIKNNGSAIKKQCLQRNKSAHSYNCQINSMGRNNTYSYSTSAGKDNNANIYNNNGRNGRKPTIAKQDKNNVASIHSHCSQSQSQSQYRNGYGNWNQIANPWFQVKNITTSELAHGILLQPQSSQVNPIYLSQLQQFYAVCTKKQIVSRPAQLQLSSYKRSMLNSCINNTAQLMSKNLSLSMLNSIKNYQKQMMEDKNGNNQLGICYRYGGQSKENKQGAEKEKKNQEGEREVLVGWDFGDKEAEEVEQMMEQGCNNQLTKF